MWVSFFEDGRLYSQSSESTFSFFVSNGGDVSLVSQRDRPILADAKFWIMEIIPDSVQDRIECIRTAS